MSKMKLSGKALVLQIDRYQLRIAKLICGAAAPQVQATHVVDLPEGTVEDGMIRDIETLVSILKNALEAPEFKHIHRAVILLCTSQVISDQTQVPNMSGARLDKVLTSNMDMYFPVDTSDYQMVHQVVGPAGDDMQTIQLWAVPKSMLQRYYLLANTCGLSVLAVDYMAHSLANATGTTFTAPLRKKEPKKKKKNAVETAETHVYAEESRGDTVLYMGAEKEHMVLSFAQEGQVRLQRVIQRSDWNTDMTEVLMSMEYYSASGTAGQMLGVMTGACSTDRSLASEARDALGIQVSQAADGEWALCEAASRTELDFGIPAMNKATRGNSINNGWQYGLVLAGGLVLVAVVGMTLGNKLSWSSSTSSLRAQANTLQTEATARMAEASSYQGYAENYQSYAGVYSQYSGDWDTVFDSLHTNNDNLSLMIRELEDVLPTTCTVKEIGISDHGVALVIHAPNKLEAAYSIIALRDLEYADLVDVADLCSEEEYLTNKDGEHNFIHATDMLQVLEERALAKNAAQQELINQLMEAMGGDGTAAADGSGASDTEDGVDLELDLTPEEAPTEGSNMDASSVLQRFGNMSEEERKAAWEEQPRILRIAYVEGLKANLNNAGFSEEYDDVVGGAYKTEYKPFFDALVNGYPEPETMSNIELYSALLLVSDLHECETLDPQYRNLMDKFLGLDAADNEKAMAYLNRFDAGQQAMVKQMLYWIDWSGTTENPIDKDDVEAIAALRAAYENLTFGQKQAIMARYAKEGTYLGSLSDLQDVMSWADRKQAAYRMLTENPAAFYRTVELLRKQMDNVREEDDPNEDVDLYTPISPSLRNTLAELMSALDSANDPWDYQLPLAAMMTQEPDAFALLEQMMRNDYDGENDKSLGSLAAYYLALQQGAAPADGAGTMGDSEFLSLLTDLRARKASGETVPEKNYKPIISDPITDPELWDAAFRYTERILDDLPRAQDALIRQMSPGVEEPVNPDDPAGQDWKNKLRQLIIDLLSRLSPSTSPTPTTTTKPSTTTQPSGTPGSGATPGLDALQKLLEEMTNTVAAYVSEDGQSTIEFYDDGTYAFIPRDKSKTEEGTYSFMGGKLTLVKPDGTQMEITADRGKYPTIIQLMRQNGLTFFGTTTALGGNLDDPEDYAVPLHFRYLSSGDPDTGAEFSIPLDTESKIWEVAWRSMTAYLMDMGYPQQAAEDLAAQLVSADMVYDEDVYFTVSLDYKPAMAVQEQERKGLHRDAKLPMLEVEEATE